MFMVIGGCIVRLVSVIVLSGVCRKCVLCCWWWCIRFIVGVMVCCCFFILLGICICCLGCLLRW